MKSVVLLAFMAFVLGSCSNNADESSTGNDTSVTVEDNTGGTGTDGTGGVGTGTGVIFAKIINIFSKEKMNPLIGSAGGSAVPMAARVSQKVVQEENPGNFILMHAMGPNVAGVIGSAVAAGILLSLFG